MKKRYLFIFLNNKLISCDAILPIAFEAKAKNPDLDVIFLSSDEISVSVLKQNVVLWDALNLIGRVYFINITKRQKKYPRLVQMLLRVPTLVLLIKVIVLSLIGKSRIIHFGALNYFPFSVIPKLAPYSVFLCDPTVAGYSKNEMLVDNMERKRKFNDSVSAMRAGLILFSHNSKYSQIETVPKFVLGEFWYGNEWIKFIKERSADYLNQFFECHDRKTPSSYFVYILGYMGKVELVEDDSVFEEKLYQTLTAFYEASPDITVLIKPHFNTDLNYLSEVVSNFSGNNFLICNLHPAVLATKASMFVANYYSSTMGVAKTAGVRVVEFSKYSAPALQITKNKGMRPDVVDIYINDDEKAFRKVISSSVPATNEVNLPDCKLDSSGISNLLSGG